MTDPGGLAGDGFGHSVAEDTSTIAVGAPGANATSGVAYIYGLSEGTWTLGAAIGSPDGAPGDAFGDSMSLSPSLDYFGPHYPKPAQDTAVLVGAPGQNAPSGAAYLLYKDKGSTDWQKHELTSPSDSGFGSSVSLSGTNAFVGSPTPPHPAAGRSTGSADRSAARMGSGSTSNVSCPTPSSAKRSQALARSRPSVQVRESRSSPGPVRAGPRQPS